MGKRGDRRRARRKEHRSRQPDIEGFTLGPVTLERHGKHLVRHLDTSHPGWNEFRQATEQALAAIPDEIASKREELRALFEPFDAFDLLADLWLVNVPKDADRFRESSDPGVMAAVELAAAILLERPHREGTKPGSWSGAVLRRANEGVLELLRLQGLGYLVDAQRRAGEGDRFGEIRGQARLNRLAVRGPSYPWQERRTLHDLFGEGAVAGITAQAVGFTIDEALALSDATERIGLDRYVERARAARQSFERIKTQVTRARAGKDIDQAYARIVEQLSGLSERQVAERLDELAVQWLSTDSGATMQFTTDELASVAGVSRAATSAFLDLLSVGFGHFAEATWTPGIDDLRDFPIISDNAGHFLCISPANLFWGLRPAIEARIKSLDAKVFGRWERHRSRVLEKRAVAALSAALHVDWAEEELYYDVTENDVDKTAELDGLLRADSALVLVEAKASSMRASARRAAPEAFRTWLRDEVGKAARQARRAREALTADPPATARDGRGEAVSIDVSGARHTLDVVVVLEDLAGVAPATWQLASSGLIPADPTPWVVNLHDLELICELVERPAQLIHYVLRRRRLDVQQRVWAQDELDFFMHYLGPDGLYWTDAVPGAKDGEAEAGAAPVQLLSFTDELDAYFAHREGDRRKPAKKPRQRLHRDVRALLDLLEETGAAGRLDAQLALLDIDTPAAIRVATGLRRLKARAASDDIAHDQTLVFDDFGITVLAMPVRLAEELPSRLQSFCTLKKHQLKKERWYGFGGAAEHEPLAQAVVVLDAPWQPDAEMDRLVSHLPSAGVDEGKFDGRRQAAESARRRRRV